MESRVSGWRRTSMSSLASANHRKSNRMLALACKSEPRPIIHSLLFGAISSPDKHVHTHEVWNKNYSPPTSLLWNALCCTSQTSRPRKQRESYHKNRPHSGTSWFRESRGPERSGCSRQPHTSVCCSRIWTQGGRPHSSGTLSKWRQKQKWQLWWL